MSLRTRRQVAAIVAKNGPNVTLVLKH